MPYLATKRITLFRTASGWAPHQDKKDKEEDPTIQLHTSLEGQAKEEIRNFLSSEFSLRVGTTSSGVVVLEAAILTFASPFFCASQEEA